MSSLSEWYLGKDHVSASMSISVLVHPDRGSSRKEGFVLSRTLKEQSTMKGKTWSPYMEALRTPDNLSTVLISGF